MILLEGNIVFETILDAHTRLDSDMFGQRTCLKKNMEALAY